ncbi:hypothetical protein Ancab_012354 [Ancistrocladus abbreviatus]
MSIYGDGLLGEGGAIQYNAEERYTTLLEVVAFTNGLKMGSGHFAQEVYGKASFVCRLQYINISGTYVTPKQTMSQQFLHRSATITNFNWIPSDFIKECLKIKIADDSFQINVFEESSGDAPYSWLKDGKCKMGEQAEHENCSAVELRLPTDKPLMSNLEDVAQELVVPNEENSRTGSDVNMTKDREARNNSDQLKNVLSRASKDATKSSARCGNLKRKKRSVNQIINSYEEELKTSQCTRSSSGNSSKTANSLPDSHIENRNWVHGAIEIGKNADEVWDVLMKLGVVCDVEDVVMVKQLEDMEARDEGRLEDMAQKCLGGEVRGN